MLVSQARFTKISRIILNLRCNFLFKSMDDPSRCPLSTADDVENNENAEEIIQKYERKIGIFDSTLQIFKENLNTLNSKYSQLAAAYQPLKAQNAVLAEKLETEIENNLIQRRHNSKLNTQLKISEQNYLMQEKKSEQLVKSIEETYQLFEFLGVEPLTLYEAMKYDKICPYKVLPISEYENLLSKNPDNNTEELEDNEVFVNEGSVTGSRANLSQKDTINSQTTFSLISKTSEYSLRSNIKEDE